MALAALRTWMKKVDWLLLVNVFFLNIFSLTALYSLNVNEPLTLNNLFIRQLLFVIVGLGLALLLSVIDYRWLKNYYKVLLVFIFVLLLLVLVFAEPIRGMTGWLEIGGQTFQPSELAKIVLIIWLARYFSEHGQDFFHPKHLLITGGLTVVLTALVAKQPDFGSAAILFITWLVFLFFTNLPKKYFVYLFLILVIVAVGLWAFVFEDYQRDRITSFLSPESDVLAEGYNVQQSIIAVGSGEILGRGLGLGPQSQLNFLPEQYSDFIFAVIAESLGFGGCLVLLSLFVLFFVRLIAIVKNSGNAFAAWLVLGFAIYLAAQVVINIAMNIGIAPVTGITLPFVSYGGSSLLTSFLTLGIIESVVVKRREKLFAD
jgi:rod shape determining protein RodA